MKQLISATMVGCLVLGLSAAAAVDWQDNYTTGLAKAKKEKKLVMVDLYATWCLPCKQLDKDTFSDNAVQARLSNEFVAVKLDFEKALNDAELSKKFATDSIPYIVFLDADGNKLSEFVGFLAPEEFLKELDKATQKAAKK